jgi:putative DNA primase/helicase
LIRGDTIKPEAVDWCWPDYIAAGKVHILAGAAGTGKTTLALTMAATITTGGRWPDGTRAPDGDVLIWSGEDTPADTLVPRLLAAGADMARIHFVGPVLQAGEAVPFDPAQHFPELALAASRLPELRLMIVDPIVSAVSGDSHKNAEVRRSLQPLVDFAERVGCALLGITHFTKFTQGKEPLERLVGSLGFGAVARVVLGTAKLKVEDGGGRVLVRVKNNLGPDGGGFKYELRQVELTGEHSGIVASRVEWCEAVDGAAREILASAEADGVSQDRPARTEAAEWLRGRIADAGGEMDRRDVMVDAGRAGFAERTVDRARPDAGVSAHPTGFGKDKRSLWRIDDATIPPIPPRVGANGQGSNPATIPPIAPSATSGGNGANDGGNVVPSPPDDPGEVF